MNKNNIKRNKKNIIIVGALVVFSLVFLIIQNKNNKHLIKNGKFTIGEITKWKAMKGGIIYYYTFKLNNSSYAKIKKRVTFRHGKHTGFIHGLSTEQFRPGNIYWSIFGAGWFGLPRQDNPPSIWRCIWGKGAMALGQVLCQGIPQRRRLHYI